MIKVLATDQFVEIEGHSGTAEKGKDIICAAVSALGNTAGSIMWDEPEVRDGYLLIRWQMYDRAEFHFIRFLMAGLRLIANEYPEAITIDDRRTYRE